MKNLVLTILLMLAGMAVRGQKVTPLSASKPVAGGATYFLLQVGLVVNVPITTTTYTLGPDSSCSTNFFYFPKTVNDSLGIGYQKKSSFSTYSIENVSITPKAIIDTSKGFEMAVKGGGNKVNFVFDENGFLVSDGIENNTNPVATALKVIDVAYSTLLK